MPMPRKNPPKDAQKRIEQYTLEHYGTKAIAKMFGVSKEVFYRWLKENPELAEAREACLGIEEKQAVDLLWKNAEKGNVAAQIFLLKARHHYSDRGDVADQQNVQVNITLPGAVRLAEYKTAIATAHPELVKQIEHEKNEEQDDGIHIDRA